MEISVRGRTAAPNAPHAPGFTLLELMISLALALILITSVVPGLGAMVDRNRITARTNEFVTFLQLTRMEAIRSGVRAVLCPSLDGNTCRDSNQWHQGWILFRDSNRNGRRDTNEALVRQHGALSSVTITSGTYRRRLSYLSSGMSYGSNTTITVCPLHGTSAPLAIVLSNPGRPRIARQGPGGRPLSCPD
jgi:type IV fimbrial biogenesis protein FimT